MASKGGVVHMATTIGYVAAGIVAVVLFVVWRLQVAIAERRRLLTALWLELAAHEEALSICERADYAIPLAVKDWPWVRYFLAGVADPQLLSDVSAYYSAVELGWNLTIEGRGQAQDAHQKRILRSLMETNARLYKQLEDEVKLLYQPRKAWRPWLRNIVSAQARLRQRVAQMQAMQKSRV